MKKRLKKYLIPHKENDYKPHLLRPKFVALVCLVVVVFEGAFLFGARYLEPRSKLFGIIVSNVLIDETNESRTANDMAGLRENSLLDAAAQLKANDMAKNNYFAHTSPTGLTPWYWFQQVGYNFDYAGENLAVNFSDSQDVTNAWMNSPEHRANILDANYTDIGMATAQGMYEGHPATYVVELFGSEAPAPAATIAIPGISAAQAATRTPIVKPKPITQKPSPTGTPIVTSRPTSTLTATPATSSPATSTQTVSTTEFQSTSTGVLGTLGADSTPPPPKASSFIQGLLADPKALANDFYLFLMFVFALALGLNVFVKIRVQYPRLIFGGLLVIVIAGLAIMLNQSAVAHIAIL